MIRATLLTLALALWSSLALAQENVTSAQGATLRGLDRVTGTLVDITLAAGEMRQFGRLQVTLGECRYPTADPSSNAYAYLSIFDAGSQQAQVFQGWMIAASPALNALDHPRYDIWVLRCNTA
ncbi:MAG: hypothetical protein ACJA1E_000503 [Paracoccaceae bacterium]|jgi:hypothetical protein